MPRLRTNISFAFPSPQPFLAVSRIALLSSARPLLSSICSLTIWGTVRATLAAASAAAAPTAAAAAGVFLRSAVLAVASFFRTTS